MSSKHRSGRKGTGSDRDGDGVPEGDSSKSVSNTFECIFDYSCCRYIQKDSNSTPKVKKSIGIGRC